MLHPIPMRSANGASVTAASSAAVDEHAGTSRRIQRRVGVERRSGRRPGRRSRTGGSRRRSRRTRGHGVSADAQACREGAVIRGGAGTFARTCAAARAPPRSREPRARRRHPARGPGRRRCWRASAQSARESRRHGSAARRRAGGSHASSTGTIRVAIEALSAERNDHLLNSASTSSGSTASEYSAPQRISVAARSPRIAP